MAGLARRAATGRRPDRLSRASGRPEQPYLRAREEPPGNRRGAAEPKCDWRGHRRAENLKDAAVVGWNEWQSETKLSSL